MNATVTILLITFIVFAVVMAWLMDKVNDKEHEIYMQVLDLTARSLKNCEELSNICKKQNELLEELEHDNKLLKDQLDAKSSDCIHCPYVTNVHTGSSPWSEPYPEGTH